MLVRLQHAFLHEAICLSMSCGFFILFTKK